MYVHPGSTGFRGHLRSFVAWRSAAHGYRYLLHYIQHPALWRHLKGGTLRSWGAKSLEESGSAANRSSPAMASHASARAPARTNMLTGSGVDEAWTTGAQLGEAVLELLRAGTSLHKRESRQHL